MKTKDLDAIRKSYSEGLRQKNIQDLKYLGLSALIGCAIGILIKILIC